MNSEQEKTNLKLSTNLGSVLERARSVARNWCHNCVGPEHVLFAIMDRDVSDEGYAYRIISSILNNNRRNEPELIQALECTHGHGPVNDADTNIPLTPRTRKVLSTAYKVSKRMEHGVVCTLHFLLATLEEGGNDAYRALSQSGITYDKVLDEFWKQSKDSQQAPDQQSTPKTESGNMEQNTGTDILEYFNQLTKILDTDFNKLPAIVRVAGDNLKNAALIALNERSWFNQENNAQELIHQLSLETSLWFGLNEENILRTIANIFTRLDDSTIRSLRTAFGNTSIGSIQERRIGFVLQLATGLENLTKTVVINFLPSLTPL